jgi:hypothetical protein
MEQEAYVSEDRPIGYLSEENKKKFTITAGVLGALFFFGQIIVPFLLVNVVYEVC